jgi:PHD/YefM family antitoxin component YafN of YafNO toxin-antitoxin module
MRGPGWKLPRWPIATYRKVILGVCQVARDTIDAARVARLRGDGEALDGHALLCRLKVAAVLAIIDGRVEITEQDWDLARVIATKSEWTRQEVVRTLEQKRHEANTARGKAEAERTLIVAETVEDAAIKRVARAIVRKLSREWIARNDLRKMFAGRDRGYIDAAIDRLVEAGQIEADDTKNQGPAGVRYRLAEEAS